MSAHLTEPIPDPSLKVPSLNALTKNLIFMSMAKEPDKRFLNYEALINACSEAITALSGQSTNAPQFLRKPLVLKSAMKKPATDRVQKPSSGEPLEVEDTEAQREAVSTRIRAKHQDMRSSATAPASADMKPATAAIRAVTKQYDPAQLPVTAPIEQPLFTRKHLTPLPTLPPVQTPSSMILDEEARQTVGTGVMPWLLLAFAFAALAGYLIFLRN
jgi:hypothetical protein